MIASGILLSEEGVKDPCEREEASPIQNLTKQEKEDVTKSAQYYLRLMHFRQIHKVLGMEMEDADDSKDETTSSPKEEAAASVAASSDLAVAE